MDSNTYSARRRGRLASLIAEIDALRAEDLEGLTDNTEFNGESYEAVQVRVRRFLDERAVPPRLCSS